MKAVHIGFPKTATTWLQSAVFPKLAGEGLVYVGKMESGRFFAPLTDDDDTIFDPRSMARRIEERTAGAPGALFSWEGLTGDARSGFANRSPIARRLREIGFERVLITIRNQVDVLESAYKQHVRSGGVLRPREYLPLGPARPGGLHPRYFDYHLVWALYAGLFGPENVLVLQYEALGDPRLGQALSDFLGTGPVALEPRPPTNRSLSYGKTVLLRAVNRFTHSSSNPGSLLPRRLSSRALHRLLAALPSGDGDRSFLDEEDRAAIRALYADSNRRLAAAAGITLAPEYP